MRQHQMEKKSAYGHGSWLECRFCGAIKWGGKFWLAGRSSPNEPPCDDLIDSPEYKQWQSQASDPYLPPLSCGRQPKENPRSTEE